MKRFVIFIGVILALALFTINLKYITPAHSQTETVNVYEQQTLVKSVVFAIGVNKYFVDGDAAGVTMDARPFIQNDRTYVPVRYLANALGVPDSNIVWDGAANKVTLNANNKVEMVVGESYIVTNGTKKVIDVAPVIVASEGRTYLPARYVAEALGYEVGWDGATQTVICWPRGEAMPDVAAIKQAVAELKKPRPVGSVVNGYSIPKDTSLYIFDQPQQVGTDGKRIVFQIRLKKGNIEQQYADARYILLQKFDAALVNEVIAYAMTMQDPILSPVPVDGPPTKTYTSNNMAVRVGYGGGYNIQFSIWATK